MPSGLRYHEKSTSFTHSLRHDLTYLSTWTTWVLLGHHVLTQNFAERPSMPPHTVTATISLLAMIFIVWFIFVCHYNRFVVSYVAVLDFLCGSLPWSDALRQKDKQLAISTKCEYWDAEQADMLTFITANCDAATSDIVLEPLRVIMEHTAVREWNQLRNWCVVEIAIWRHS